MLPPPEETLVPIPPDRSLEQLAETVRRAQDYAGRAKAPSTVKAYSASWRDFTTWADTHARAALPATPETVALYLAAMANRGAKPATIARRLVVISQAHKATDLTSPTASSAVRRVHAGIRRTHGTAQTTKAPALVGQIRTMVEQLPQSRLGLRDRALLLLGFAGAFRRAELVGLDVRDLEFGSSGLVVTLRRSKTDQEGAGRRIGIPYGSTPLTCPVRAVQTWLATATIAEGPVFRAVDRASSQGACRTRPSP